MHSVNMSWLVCLGVAENRKQLMNSMGFDDQNLTSVLARVAAAGGGTQWSLTWESGSVDGLGRL